MTRDKLQEYVNVFLDQASCPVKYKDRIEAFQGGAVAFANFFLQATEKGKEEEDNVYSLSEQESK